MNHFLIPFSIVSYILATSLAFADHSPKNWGHMMSILNNMGPCQRAWGTVHGSK